MSAETPTTDRVREDYAHLRYHYADGWSIGEERVLFDRWLAEHDRQVKAEALRDLAKDWDQSPERHVALWLRDRADRIEDGHA